MQNLIKNLSLYESIYRYLWIKIGVGVYRLFLSKAPNGDVVGHMKGVVVPPKSLRVHEPPEKITDCCVFTSWLDLLAYIYLQKIENEEVCYTIWPCDYMVISPSQSLVQPYEHLKRYENVYGYIECSDDGKVVNSLLKDLLEEQYTDKSHMYKSWGSVIRYVISTFKYIEI